MKKFTLYWLDGGTDEVEGNDIADAMTRAGFGNGALAALDYWEKNDDPIAITGYDDVPDGWSQ